MFKERLNLRKVATIIACLAVTSMMFSGCKKDDSTNGNSVTDPAGTVTINVRNDALYESGIGWYGVVYITTPDGQLNLVMTRDNNFAIGSYVASISLKAIGKVSSLGDITEKPSNGYSTFVAVEKGVGYVGKITFDENNNTKYIRIYVVDFLYAANSGGIIGATIKYQYPWD